MYHVCGRQLTSANKSVSCNTPKFCPCRGVLTSGLSYCLAQCRWCASTIVNTTIVSPSLCCAVNTLAFVVSSMGVTLSPLYVPSHISSLLALRLTRKVHSFTCNTTVTIDHQTRSHNNSTSRPSHLTHPSTRGTLPSSNQQQQPQQRRSTT